VTETGLPASDRGLRSGEQALFSYRNLLHVPGTCMDGLKKGRVVPERGLLVVPVTGGLGSIQWPGILEIFLLVALPCSTRLCCPGISLEFLNCPRHRSHKRDCYYLSLEPSSMLSTILFSQRFARIVQGNTYASSCKFCLPFY
jgi:hypothetical protein